MNNGKVSRASPRVAGVTRFLWVDLSNPAGPRLVDALNSDATLACVTDPSELRSAIERHAPLFLCFEFDDLDAAGAAALAHVRCAYPRLPVLMIAGSLPQQVALWVLRIRVWDLLLKPVRPAELRRRIAALAELACRRRRWQGRAIVFPAQDEAAAVERHQPQGRTDPAIAHVARYFGSRISLDQAAELCRMSASQFCRVFRREHGASFSQYLLRYRIERACERLAYPGALAKEVAYSVGFNDLSYFTRIFKRETGVCPSVYQGGARSS